MTPLYAPATPPAPWPRSTSTRPDRAPRARAAFPRHSAPRARTEATRPGRRPDARNPQVTVDVSRGRRTAVGRGTRSGPYAPSAGRLPLAGHPGAPAGRGGAGVARAREVRP
ncbi:hypothetical protein QFZ82_002704 [Streptomyces sp. V4I23]|nr:hypothetical protein [Streptomyces sp. V4I23]